jgi:hypothetical protein
MITIWGYSIKFTRNSIFENLQQEERKRLLENEKKILARRESQYVEQQKNKTNIESGLKNFVNNLFLQKVLLDL